VCIAGADEGLEFQLKDRECSIGRDPTCTVTLADPSVSREHAQILADGDRYIVIDQESGNGTFVGGEKVNRARIESGDEIAFGNAVFRFLEAGQAADPRSPVHVGRRAKPSLLAKWKQAPHFKAAFSGALVLTLVLIGGIAGGVMQARAGDVGLRNKSFRLYEKGIEAFRQRDWDKAEEQFNKALEQMPDHGRSRRYLEEVTRERKLGGRLKGARDAMKQNDLASAYELASAISDSVYHKEASELLFSIDANLRTMVARAEQSIRGNRLQEAEELLAQVDRIRPGRPEVMAGLDKIAIMLGSDKNASVPPAAQAQAPEAKVKRGAKRRGASKRTTKVATSPTSPPPRNNSPPPAKKREGKAPKDPVDRALWLLGRGEVEKAKDALDEAESSNEIKILRSRIGRFSRDYTKGIEAYDAGRVAAGIQGLEGARKNEANLTGGGTALSKEIRTKLADLYYMHGVEAMQQDRYAEAFRSFRKASSNNKAHKPTQRGLEKLEKIAKGFYAAGVKMMQSDPSAARQRFDMILNIVPQNNEYYDKAKQQLRELL
jgi:tetratricopeptide (TPR) repeat protein